MQVWDPVGQRVIWTSAVIEGDRDPSRVDQKTLKFPWSLGAPSAIDPQPRGWFGTLSVPRLVVATDLSRFYSDNSTDVFLSTPPLPELSELRVPDSHTEAGKTAPVPLAPGELKRQGATGRELELDAVFAVPPPAVTGGGNASAGAGSEGAGSEGWDFGLQLLWSGGHGDQDEWTRVGVRDGAMLPGVDLWDEVNGDSSNATAATASACRALCAADDTCGAWTWTSPSLCRLKALPQHALQAGMAGPAATTPSAPCWLPYRPGSVSGYKSRPGGLRFASLYVDRARSWKANSSCPYPSCDYGLFRFSSLLRLLPNETSVRLHAFVDRSIVEVFAQDGRAAVTARVYPARAESRHVGIYAGAAQPASLLSLDTWQMQAALVKDPPTGVRSTQ